MSYILNPLPGAKLKAGVITSWRASWTPCQWTPLSKS